MAGPDGTNGTPGPKLLAAAKAGTIGSVLDLVGVKNINDAQQAALHSRLHIPLIFSLDVIHGYKTMFPVPLGEAATWDPATVRTDEAVSAREATADGIKWTFNPMVDISRDPRWGRVVEGAGEDPFLGSAIAAAKVRGYQGNDFSAPNKMAATVKHFAGYGAPVAGREYNTVDMSLQQFDNDYAPPYKAAVDDVWSRTASSTARRSPLVRSRAQCVSRKVGMLASQMRPQWAPPSERPSTVRGCVMSSRMASKS
jgi:beta-glucosidase